MTVNIDESKSQSHDGNVSKNRKTLALLLVMFVTPVLLAYAAYFGSWFSGENIAQGELIDVSQVTDIEDYTFVKKNGQVYTGKEFETLYWWVIPIDPRHCDQKCTNLNLYMVNQTYLGLGKEASRINQLVVFDQENPLDPGVFPSVTSEFSPIGIKANAKTSSGKGLDLKANYIYLVDPLGNIFMRYSLIETREAAPLVSRMLRKDILHLFKYSRLG